MAVTRIEFRRGTAAEWATENPVLTAAEPGYETDTGLLKVGDGTTAWNSLGYVGDPTDPMSFEDATDASPSSSPGTISPLVLQSAIIDFIESRGSNVWMMPIWDGTGTHPVRPDAAATMFVIWRQPTAPLVDDDHSHEGDEWEVTEA